MEVALNNVDKMKHGLALETLNMDFNPHCCWDLRSCKDDITLPKIFSYRIWFSCFESTKLKFMVKKKKKSINKDLCLKYNILFSKTLTYILKDLLLWNLIPVLRLTKLKFKGGKNSNSSIWKILLYFFYKNGFFYINFLDFV